MHYRKVTMHMLINVINHVQYYAGLLYKYWKLHLMINILFLPTKDSSFGKRSHLVTLALLYFHRCQSWIFCIKLTSYPVGAYLTTEIQIDDMHYNMKTTDFNHSLFCCMYIHVKYILFSTTTISINKIRQPVLALTFDTLGEIL